MPNLTKRDLVMSISNETGLVQKNVFNVIERTFSHIIEHLSSGGGVELRNFGTFEVKIRKARVGRNPHHPEHTIPIPPCPVVKFKAGKEMKTKVRKLYHAMSTGK